MNDCQQYHCYIEYRILYCLLYKTGSTSSKHNKVLTYGITSTHRQMYSIYYCHSSHLRGTRKDGVM